MQPYFLTFSKDTLAKDNYSHNAKSAHKSQNIHPVIRYYKQAIRGNYQ